MTYSRRYQRPEAKSVLILIGLNLILFIAYLFNDSLIGTLGLQPSTWTKEPWTVLTSMFMHAGVWHIMANMFTLYFLGSYLCNMIGDKIFLIIYFIGGIIGSFFFILFSLYTPIGDPYSLVIGASGAIFAVAGALTALAPKVKVVVFPIPVPMPLWVAIIGGFLLMSFLPGVAWEAHLGGLLVGLIAGFILRKRKHNIFML
ncbi:MAG: rhomboid family intramembrane serine protease [Dehalococcoidia bacterium]|jgi:membrane associated rhomboid family serine protease